MKMKNRTLIGIVCIVLAVAVTFLVSPLVNRISEQKTDVIRFTKDISHGSKIAETDIEIVKLSKSSVPEKALKTKDAVVGKYAKADLFKGDLATEIKITDDEIPKIPDLDKIYDAISLPKTPGEIGISDELLPLTFKTSKDIRDKYVLPRLFWDLGIIEEVF